MSTPFQSRVNALPCARHSSPKSLFINKTCLLHGFKHSLAKLVRARQSHFLFLQNRVESRVGHVLRLWQRHRLVPVVHNHHDFFVHAKLGSICLQTKKSERALQPAGRELCVANRLHGLSSKNHYACPSSPPASTHRGAHRGERHLPPCN
jgi:hypothetical protein